MEVKITSRSHNSTAELHYLFYGKYKRGGVQKLNTPHQNDNGVTVRNHYISGVNCPATYTGAVNAFNYYNHQKKRNKIQSLDVVISFSPGDFDFSKPRDVLEATKLGRKFVKDVYPNHEAVIFAQDDNTNATPHLHIPISYFNQATLKAIDGKGNNIHYLRREVNTLTDEYNRSHTHQLVSMPKVVRREHEERIRQDFQRPYTVSLNGTTPAEKAILTKLEPILNDNNVTSESKFRKACKRAGLRAKFSRAGTSTHRRRNGRRRSRRRRRKHNGLAIKLDKKLNPHVNNHRYIKASVLRRFDKRIDYKNLQHLFSIHKASLSRERARQRTLKRLKTQHSIEAEAQSAKAQSLANQPKPTPVFASSSVVQPAMATYSSSAQSTSSNTGIYAVTPSGSRYIRTEAMKPILRQNNMDTHVIRDLNGMSSHSSRIGYSHWYNYVLPTVFTTSTKDKKTELDEFRAFRPLYKFTKHDNGIMNHTKQMFQRFTKESKAKARLLWADGKQSISMFWNDAKHVGSLVNSYAKGLYLKAVDKNKPSLKSWHVFKYSSEMNDWNAKADSYADSAGAVHASLINGLSKASSAAVPLTAEAKSDMNRFEISNRPSEISESKSLSASRSASQSAETSIRAEAQSASEARHDRAMAHENRVTMSFARSSEMSLKSHMSADPSFASSYKASLASSGIAPGS